MNTLSLSDGNTIKLKNKDNRESIFIVHADDTCLNGFIRMNRVPRFNLRVHINDIVTFHGRQDLPNCRRIGVAPIEDTYQGITGDLISIYLKPYFRETSHLPVREGDIIIINAAMHTVQFKVMTTEPNYYCAVTERTHIDLNNPIKREKDAAHLNEVGYDDIGGSVKQLAQIKLIQLSLNHSQQLLNTFQMKPPRSILLCGPSGTGMLK